MGVLLWSSRYGRNTASFDHVVNSATGQGRAIPLQDPAVTARPKPQLGNVWSLPTDPYWTGTHGRRSTTRRVRDPERIAVHKARSIDDSASTLRRESSFCLKTRAGWWRTATPMTMGSCRTRHCRCCRVKVKVLSSLPQAGRPAGTSATARTIITRRGERRIPARDPQALNVKNEIVPPEIFWAASSRSSSVNFVLSYHPYAYSLHTFS